MTVSYTVIFSRFLAKIKDYSFLILPECEANEFMTEWLHSTISKPHVRKLFTSFSSDDEIQEINFEMYNSVDENYDMEIILEILIEGMMIEWLTPRVNSIENVAQMFGGNEEKFYSQSNHLSELQNLLFSLKNSQRKLVRDFGYEYEVLSKREAK